MFKVSYLFIYYLDDQFRSASINLQQLKLWILFTGHSSMVYGRWEGKIYHSLIKSTWYSLHSLWGPSSIACQPGKQVSLGFCQSWIQEVEYNKSATPGTLLTCWLMHAEMYSVIWKKGFFLPHQRFNTKTYIISAASCAEGSTQPVWTQQCYNLTTISATLKRIILIIS